MSFLTRSAPSAQEMAREAYIKKNMTEMLGKALKALQSRHVDSEEPIYSEDSANTVCNIIEAVFLHGLKASFSQKLSSYLIGIDHSKTRQPSFWELLTQFSHKDVVSQLNHLGQITTEIGMCRAWLRVALNDGVLESYLDAMLADSGALRHFYKRTAYLRDEEQAGIFKSYSQGIQNFRFQLSYNSSVLNIWTTTPLVLAGLLEQTVTPRAVISTSTSESALSQITMGSSANETHDLNDIRHVGRSKTSQPPIVSSHSYHGNLQGAVASPRTPPNSPYSPTSLSISQIEEIRKLAEKRHKSGSASTPPSQISCPDYALDGRFPSSPDVCSDDSKPLPLLTAMPVDNEGDCSSVDVIIDEDRKNESMQTVIKEEGAVGGAPAPVPLSTESFRPITGLRQKNVEGDTNDALNKVFISAEEIGVTIETTLPTEPEEACSLIEPGDIYDDASKAADLDEVHEEVVEADRKKEELIKISPHRTAANRPKTINPTILNQSSDFTAPPLQLRNRKSDVLQPVLTDATAQVEVAREVSPTTTLLSSPSDPGPDVESHPEMGTYVESPASPQSNQLGAMQGHGWSSEFEEPVVPSEQVKEETPAKVSVRTQLSVQESYNSMLQNYTPGMLPAANMIQLLDNLPVETPGTDRTNTPTDELTEENIQYLDEYDILPVGLNVTSEQADARTQQLVSLIGQICNEKGLDQQNYQCNGCSRPIGMIYGKARACAYDGCYYCYECHENDEAIIPSRVIHNWDFSKLKVASHTVRFLKQVEDDPLLNIQRINPRLYDHVPKVKEVREVRTQLRFLKAYLFTCKQSVADDLRKQVWPREYLYDDIHMYSVQDLLQIPTGQLAASLRKVIKYASKHVYDCRLCSQKGFICEVCANPKVIYPFEADTTCRCDQCNAVYHRDCKPVSGECPKCLRRRQRQMSLGSDLGERECVDYAYVAA